jgi:hypothetical protein
MGYLNDKEIGNKNALKERKKRERIVKAMKFKLHKNG